MCKISTSDTVMVLSVQFGIMQCDKKVNFFVHSAYFIVLEINLKKSVWEVCAINDINS